MPSLREAIREWEGLLGQEHVLTDQPALDAVSRATFPTTQAIPAVIRPGDRAAVQGCLGIANRYRVPVYPVSAGKNWGYGSSVPVASGTVVMALDRMARIVDYDEELAYATVEPGVTFRGLNDFLRSRGSRLFLNCPGNSADASVIGLCMERGLIPGPDANRWEHMCGLEVVLPTGECLSTGHERFPGLRTAKVFRQGLGPFVDGLFTQSNLGVVTKMTVWITPFPEHFQSFTFTVEDQARLAECTEELRGLRMRGVLGESCALYNDYRVLSFVGQYPWQEAAGATPLPESLLDSLREELGGARWYGEAGIAAASRDEGEAKRCAAVQSLQGCADALEFAEPNTEDSYFNPGLNTSLSSIYWRKKVGMPDDADPGRDRCGVIWCAPVVPFRGPDLLDCLDVVEQTLGEFRFEPGVTIRCMTPRVLYVLAGVIYDRAVSGEDERAMECYRALFDRLQARGYCPYRLGIQSMPDSRESVGDYAAVLRRIKRALDPNNILAPGRYECRG